MLKKTIAYTDYNDNERTEDFYFNLSKAELAEMELTTTGGYAATMQRIVDAQDTPTLIMEFKALILNSYGEKSPDGKRFVKSKELAEAFSQTEAYSNLFMELSTNTQAATDFANGIIPVKLNDALKPIK